MDFNLIGTVYEVGDIKLSHGEIEFIEAFMAEPNKKFPLRDGEVNRVGDDNTGAIPGRGRGLENNYVKGKLKKGEYTVDEPRLQVFEVDDDVWALCLVKEPEICICQMDHANSRLRANEQKDYSPYTQTVFNAILKIFGNKFKGKDNYDYTTSGDMIAFTPSTIAAQKFISKFDLSKWMQF